MDCKSFSLVSLLLFADSVVAANNYAVGSWVAISTEKACQQNGEGIEVIGTRGFIPDLKACRTACLMHGTCIAVDFFAQTGVCQFYDRSCITPGASGHGACSYHMPRSAEFQAIDDGAACEENDEGIVQIEGAARQAIASIEHCQAECLRNSHCRAVDFYRRSGYCIFYETPCTMPKSKHDGASSFKVVKHLEERTIVDVKRDLLAQAKSKKAWSVIESGKACEGNHEDIEPIQGASKSVDNVQACKDMCQDHDSCAAIDFYKETSYCVMYTEACVRPLANHADPVSFQLKTQEPKWETINQNKACESNKEGVERITTGESTGGRQETSLASCQKACWQKLECFAVDYYRDSNWCNFYHEACSTPLSTAAGASSYRLTRPRGSGKAGKPMVRTAGTSGSVQYGQNIQKATSVLQSDMGQRVRESEM